MKRLPNVKAWSRVWTLALLALLMPSLGSAQSQATTAEINGRVTDSQGGLLPGVTVTARNAATGYSRTIATNETGAYLLSLLPPQALTRVSAADLAKYHHWQGAAAEEK